METMKKKQTVHFVGGTCKKLNLELKAINLCVFYWGFQCLLSESRTLS